MLLSNSRTNTVGASPLIICTVPGSSLCREKALRSDTPLPSLRTVQHAKLTLKRRSRSKLSQPPQLKHARPRLSTCTPDAQSVHVSNTCRGKPQLTHTAPTLTRHAAQRQQRKKRDSRPKNKFVAPCFPVTRRFKKRPYLTSFKLAAHGFIHRFERLNAGTAIPAAIASLCVDYAFEREAGVFQIGFQLHRVLKKTKRHSVTRTMVVALVAQYLKLSDVSEAQLYVDELVRLRYIAAVQLNEDKYHTLFVVNSMKGESPRKLAPKDPLYEIPIDAALQFNAGRKSMK